jgi:ArsR family transcriptional regulator
VADQAMKSTLRVTKALADVQRVRILLLLEEGELCVCQIIEVLGLAPSTVSKHLYLLSSAELVEMRKDGRWAYYRLPGNAPDSVRPLLEWLKEALKDDATIEQDRVLLKQVRTLDQCEVARGQRCR